MQKNTKIRKALFSEFQQTQTTVRIICYSPHTPPKKPSFEEVNWGDSYYFIKNDDGTETPWCRETYTVGTHTVEDFNRFQLDWISKDLTEKGWTTVQGDFGLNFICPHCSARSSK